MLLDDQVGQDAEADVDAAQQSGRDQGQQRALQALLTFVDETVEGFFELGLGAIGGGVHHRTLIRG